MQILRGCVIATMGLPLFIDGTSKNQFVICKLLVARSKILWDERMHRFHQVAGILIVAFGILVAIGVIQ